VKKLKHRLHASNGNSVPDKVYVLMDHVFHKVGKGPVYHYFMESVRDFNSPWLDRFSRLNTAIDL